MKTTNKVLIAVIVILVAAIGYEGHSFYSDNYAVSNIKPYVDPYKQYSRDELKAMMEKGDLDATAEYGIRLMDEDKDVEAGYRLCLKAASAANARGENAVGSYYGDKKDYAEAVKWYTKAAEHKCLYAKANLANCYFLGNGVKEDKGKSFSLYREVAMKGLVEAINQVGSCYLNGYGVSNDEKAAFKWFSKAAELGDSAAYNNLALCYAYGHGVEKDEKAGVAWYTKSANKGNTFGMYGLATCYADGTGVAKDEKKAHELYMKAAELGNPFAQYEVGKELKDGVAYKYENGVTHKKVNPQKAFEWFTKSAKQEYALAQVALSECYMHGTGVERNFDKARYWMALAAKQGDEDAQKKIKNWSSTVQNILNQEASAKRVEEEYQLKYGHLGTFEFKDRLGNEWILTVKNDETATIKTKGSDHPAYASWYKYDNMKYAKFRCSEKGPMIAFPGSEIYMHDNGYAGVIGAEACGYFCIDGKYIYYDSTAADAKNPEFRLPLKKI